MSERFVVLSGCSGGGKSSLLAALARRGHAVVEEPGRRIVAEETRSGGSALPWTDPERPNGLEDAVAEYGRLSRAYAGLDYWIVILPKTGIEARADFVLEKLGSPA